MWISVIQGGVPHTVPQMYFYPTARRNLTTISQDTDYHTDNNYRCIGSPSPLDQSALRDKLEETARAP
eukprot:3753689-Pleurochrysis_carterae.AAC.3